MAMGWFIFSEVMFFAVFFGALFYARQLSLPWLGGEGSDVWTNLLLWPGFENTWPSNGPGNVGGKFEAMGAVGHPGAQHRDPAHQRRHHHDRAPCPEGQPARHLAVFLALTFLLGFLFLGCQAYEYTEAFTELNLTLKSGIYGTTFFMLTGFHGLHVTIGAIMLTVIWLRVLKGHFTPDRHFAFEAWPGTGTSWTWSGWDCLSSCIGCRSGFSRNALKPLPLSRRSVRLNQTRLPGDHQQQEQDRRERDPDRQRAHDAARSVLVLHEKEQPRSETRQDREQHGDDQQFHETNCA